MFFELDELEFMQEGMVVAVTQIHKTKSGIIQNTSEEFDTAKKSANPTLKIVKLGPGCTTGLKVGDQVFFSKQHIHAVEPLDWITQPEEGKYMCFNEGMVSVRIPKKEK